MLLGVLLAIRLRNVDINMAWPSITLAFISICLIASGNYGINEVPDATSDAYHPEKRNRAMPSGKVGEKLILGISSMLYLGGFLLLIPTNKM